MDHFYRRILPPLTLALAAGAVSVFGDVVPKISSSGTSVTIENGTPSSWTLGGVRFLNDGWKWERTPESMIDSWFTVSNIDRSGKNEINLYFKSNAPADQYARLTPNTTRLFNHPWGNFPETTKPIPGTEALLIKTGSPGMPDNPLSEDPITLEELAQISSTPDFYSETYRPDTHDSLGSNGGVYSAGFMDTWYGETQLHFPIPNTTYKISNTDVHIVKDDHFYWMGLGLVQEYLDVDMQVLLAMGMKETFAGTNAFQQSYLNGTEYTTFHVEAPSGLDRALTYPDFFPKYKERLSSARDVASSGIDMNEFMAYYTRAEAGETILNSATSINGAIFSSLFLYSNYDLLAYATDIPWKEELEKSATDAGRDPYMGLSAMVVAYNQGMWGHIGNIKAQLESGTADRNSFGTGNNNYIYDLYDVIQSFIDASRESLTDNTVELLDFPITKEMMLAVYFGDNGTVVDQGDGGLLRHFYEEDQVELRQAVWDTVSAAFDILKGRAPSVQGQEAISYRYDFLALMRTVKGEIDFSRDFIPAGDAQTLVQNYSDPNSGSNYDEVYPYGGVVNGSQDYNTEFVVDIWTEDETAVQEVTWSIDSTWSSWFPAEFVSGTDTEKTFTVRAPKDRIEAIYGDKTGTLWYMVTDSSGNSVVYSTPIKGNPLQTAAAFDMDGDGFTDSIKVTVLEDALVPDSGDDINTPLIFKYSWSDKNNLNDVTNFVYTAPRFGFEPTDKSGHGRGVVQIEYPSMDGISEVDILDSVGPALIGRARFDNADDARQFDTLVAPITEELTNSFTNGTAYLSFSETESGTQTAVVCDSFGILAGSTDSIIALLPKGTIDNNSYRWVALTSTDGVEDLEGNKPAGNSKRIEISVTGAATELGSASAYDLSGDGMADSIAVVLNLGSAESMKASDIDTVIYKWNDNASDNDTIVAVNITAPDSFNLRINRTLFNSGNGTGDITIVFSDGARVFGKISDSTGAALTTASLDISDANRAFDELLVTTTEALKENFGTDTPYLILKDVGTESQPAVTSVQKVDDTTWKFLFSKGSLVAMDSVKILSTSSVEDLVGNSSESFNRWVKISIIGGVEPSADMAHMLDRDGDGIGDSVYVSITLGQAPGRYTMDSLQNSLEFSWNDTVGFDQVDVSRLLNRNETSFSFHVDTISTGFGEGKIHLPFPNGFTLSPALLEK